jgi:hypothetical protein
MEYLYSPFIDSWNASLSMVLELTIHQLTKITKSLNIYYVFIILRQRSITKVSQFLAPYSPLVFSLLLFSFSFVGLGEDPSKVEARKNDHQGNLGSLKSLLIGHGKRSHPFPRFVEREKRGLAIDRYTMGVR